MAENQDLQETNPLKSNQLCVGIEHFAGQEDGDLSFQVGEKIWIIEPCGLLFWYRARNQEGETGMVPSNFLEPLEEDSSKLLASGPTSISSSSGKKPPIPPAEKAASKKKAEEDDGYIHMNPKEIEQARKADMEVELSQVKEKHRRLRPGVLVVGTRPFVAQEDADLSFNVYEEMIILSPLPDLCWYHAQKTDQPEKKGSIPITHVRLVYMSEDEEEPSSSREPAESFHDRLYDDMNEFISQSGWFSFPGLPHSIKALHQVLARKAKMTYKDFIACKKAVYKFEYQGEKVFIGKAHTLHVDLPRHFDQFDTKPHLIRDIDDELCHHTSMAGWDLTVWPLQEGQDLEVECAKKIILSDSLKSKEGSGITDHVEFTTKTAFDKFWEWFSPPS